MLRKYKRLSHSESIEFCPATIYTMETFNSNLFHDAVVDIGLVQTLYTTSEAMGSVSVCVDVSSAEFARNVSVTLRNGTAGAAVGKPFKCYTQTSQYVYQQ